MHDNGVTLQKRVLQNLDIPYSYELAKRMEQYRSHPTLGYRPAGSKAEFETGEMLKTVRFFPFLSSLLFSNIIFKAATHTISRINETILYGSINSAKPNTPVLADSLLSLPYKKRF